MEFGKAIRNPNTKVGRLLYGGVAGVSALALTASGCGGSSTEGLTDSVSTSSANTAGHTGPDERTGNEQQLVFDDLGGGSSTIQVYPSPNGHPEANGTYPSGEAVGAICVTEGREVHSDPGVGEMPRHSDEWIKIHGTPGETQFATDVYTHNPRQLIMELPNC